MANVKRVCMTNNNNLSSHTVIDTLTNMKAALVIDV